MLYQRGELQDGRLVVTESKVIDQSKLTSECWLIQFEGLGACKDCEFSDTENCGGMRIRKNLLKEEA